MRDPAPRSRCWRRCCGRRATCWPGRGSTGCGAAPIPNAAGCSSTTAAPASAAGARCRPAATAPRPGGIITRARKTTPDGETMTSQTTRSFASAVGLFVVMAAAAVRAALDARLVAGLAVPGRLFRRLARPDARSGQARSGTPRAAHEGRAVGRGAAGAEDHHDLRLARLLRPAADPRLRPPLRLVTSAGYCRARRQRADGARRLRESGASSARTASPRRASSSARRPARHLDRPLRAGAPSDVHDGAGDDGGNPASRSARDGACSPSRR